MLRPIGFAFAALLAGCSGVQQPTLTARAPPGFEPFCFPMEIDFAPGAAAPTPESEAFLAALIQGEELRRYQWFLLQVWGSADQPAHLQLPRRRAAEVLRVLQRLDVRSDRVEVRFYSHDKGVPQASLLVMIPPDEAERLRFLRQHQGIIFGNSIIGLKACGFYRWQFGQFRTNFFDPRIIEDHG